MKYLLVIDMKEYLPQYLVFKKLVRFIAKPLSETLISSIFVYLPPLQSSAHGNFPEFEGYVVKTSKW